MAEGKGYESFYMGSYGPLSPEYGDLFQGYRVPAYQLGVATDPRTAHIIGEASTKLRQGSRTLEVGSISPEIFEAIPKEHLKEVQRLGKLTGVNFTLHAPIIDPAGFTREGATEATRKQAEDQMKMVVERAHELDSEGNIPVTFHATAGVPATLVPSPPGAAPTEADTVAVVDQETGAIPPPIKREKRWDPKRGQEVWMTPQEQISEANKRIWDKNFGSIAWENTRARGLVEPAKIILPTEILEGLKKGTIKEEELTPKYREALSNLRMGQMVFDDVGSHLRALYNEAMRLWPEEVKAKHEKELSEIKKRLGEIEAEGWTREKPFEAAWAYDEIMRKFWEIVKKDAPQNYLPTTDFCLERSKRTIANVALHAFKKFGDKAPVICIENYFPGTVFGTGEELARLVKESRAAFVEAAKKEGISEAKAKEAAERLIGATWDTGHIYMLRRYGFTPELTVEETKKIAPFVKHVHLADNFGFEHVELPPGMGAVPFKEMLKELEKAGFKGKKILEFAHWAQHFKISPAPYLLEAMGSPVYAMHMAPFWNQVRGQYGIPAGYESGYGLMLPEQNVGIYGVGFSALPWELGGTLPRRREGFAGVPME